MSNTGLISGRQAHGPGASIRPDKGINQNTANSKPFDLTKEFRISGIALDGNSGTWKRSEFVTIFCTVCSVSWPIPVRVRGSTSC